MTWIAVDVDLVKHRKLSRLPNDSARYGWLVTLLEAKQQQPAGSFDSPAHFRDVLGRFGRFLPFYIKAGLLEEVDGALVVHDWQQYQWAAKKQRQREDIRGTLEGQKGDVQRQVQRTKTTTGSLEPSSSLRTRGEPQRLADLLPGVVEKLA